MLRRTGFCLMLGALLAPSALYAEDAVGSPAIAAVENDGPVSAVIGNIEIVALAETAETAEPAAEAVQVIAITEDEAADEQTIRVFLQEGAEGEPVRIVLGEEAGVAVSKFWIGLDCAEPDAALRAQLGLDAGTGLVIGSVIDDSPAKAAGLQVHDVLVSAKVNDQEQKLTGIPQLAELIQQAGEKPMALSLIRGGKPITLSVTPAARPGINLVLHEQGEEAKGKPPGRKPEGRGRHGGEPGRHRPGSGPQGHGGPPWQQLQRPGSFAFRMAGPVVVKMHEEHSKLPDDMKLTITKSGSQPAEIAVTQGDKSWTVKDTELDQLPAEVRGSVQKYLGFGLMTKFGPPADFLKHVGNPFGAGPPPWMKPGGHAAPGRKADAGHKKKHGDNHHPRGDLRGHGGDGHHGHGEARRGHGSHRHHGEQNACPHCGKQTGHGRHHASRHGHGQGRHHGMGRGHHHSGRQHHGARGHHHGGPRGGMGFPHGGFGRGMAFSGRGGFGPGHGMPPMWAARARMMRFQAAAHRGSEGPGPFGHRGFGPGRGGFGPGHGMPPMWAARARMMRFQAAAHRGGDGPHPFGRHGFGHGHSHGGCPMCAAREGMARFHAGAHHGPGRGHGDQCPFCSAGQGHHAQHHGMHGMPQPGHGHGPGFGFGPGHGPGIGHGPGPGPGSGRETSRWRGAGAGFVIDGPGPGAGPGRMRGGRPAPGAWGQRQAQRPDVGQRFEEMVKHLERVRGQMHGAQPGGAPGTVSEPAPADQMKMQLHRLQEQQEQMARALRELREALDKPQPR